MVRLQRGRRRLENGLSVPAGAGKTTLAAAVAAAAVAGPPSRRGAAGLTDTRSDSLEAGDGWLRVTGWPW